MLFDAIENISTDEVILAEKPRPSHVHYGRKLHLIYLASIVITMIGCEFITKVTVPSTEDISAMMMRPFLIEADEIEGVYRNLDVDSLVFTYRTGLETEQEFLEALDSSVRVANWELFKTSPDFVEYRRTLLKTETRVFSSFEVVRIEFNPDDRSVVVAYVQADSRKSVDRYEDTEEGTFAEEVMWPKFDELRRR